jgi:hypothetical protein
MLFILSDHKWTAYVSRFLIGAFQVFLLVYYPVWIDKFGQDKKTLWLTLLADMCSRWHICRVWHNRSYFGNWSTLFCFFLYSNRIGCSIYYSIRIDSKVEVRLQKTRRPSLINIHGFNPKHKIKFNRFVNNRSSPSIDNIGRVPQRAA